MFLFKVTLLSLYCYFQRSCEDNWNEPSLLTRPGQRAAQSCLAKVVPCFFSFLFICNDILPFEVHAIFFYIILPALQHFHSDLYNYFFLLQHSWFSSIFFFPAFQMGCLASVYIIFLICIEDCRRKLITSASCLQYSASSCNQTK